MDHENMIAFGYRYFMTSEFKYLKPEEKEMLRQHIRARAALEAQENPPPGTQPPGPPGAVQSIGQPAAPAVATPAGAVTEPAAAAG